MTKWRSTTLPGKVPKLKKWRLVQLVPKTTQNPNTSSLLYKWTRKHMLRQELRRGFWERRGTRSHNVDKKKNPIGNLFFTMSYRTTISATNGIFGLTVCVWAFGHNR